MGQAKMSLQIAGLASCEMGDLVKAKGLKLCRGSRTNTMEA